MSAETDLLEEPHRQLKEDGHRVLPEMRLKEPTGERHGAGGPADALDSR